MGEPEVFGPYRVGELLGRGGMGTVHRAHDTHRERAVALKRLGDGVAGSPEFRERFRRECLLAARLSSPHVVPIHDFGEIDGVLFLDMRLIEGRGLDTVLRDGAMDPARAVRTVEQVAHALDSAHAAGLVHRDVKPSNVLVGEPDGFVHLADFGIARSVDPGTRTALTGTGAAPGTPAYLAPEVFAGATADHRADVYALACVLFETVTGRPPFEGGPVQLMYHHLHTTPPDPADVRPGLPPGLGEVVRRGMAKDPAERTGSAGELARRARAALSEAGPAGQPGPSVPPPVVGRSGTVVDVAAPPPVEPAPLEPTPQLPPLEPAPHRQPPEPAPHRQPPPQSLQQPPPQSLQQPPAQSLQQPPPQPPAQPPPQPPAQPPPQPPAQSPPQPPARPPHRPRGVAVRARVLVASLAVAAVVAAAVVVAATRSDTGAPDAPTTADTTSLRLAFPETGRAVCAPSPPLRTSAGHPSETVLACDYPATHARAEFVRWPTAADAELAVRDAGAGRTSYESEWKIELVPQGPVFLGEDGAGGWVAVGAYAGSRYGFRVRAPSRAELSSTFPAMQFLPAGQVPR